VPSNATEQSATEWMSVTCHRLLAETCSTARVCWVSLRRTQPSENRRRWNSAGDRQEVSRNGAIRPSAAPLLRNWEGFVRVRRHSSAMRRTDTKALTNPWLPEVTNRIAGEKGIYQQLCRHLMGRAFIGSNPQLASDRTFQRTRIPTQHGEQSSPEKGLLAPHV